MLRWQIVYFQCEHPIYKIITFPTRPIDVDRRSLAPLDGIHSLVHSLNHSAPASGCLALCRIIEFSNSNSSSNGIKIHLRKYLFILYSFGRRVISLRAFHLWLLAVLLNNSIHSRSSCLQMFDKIFSLSVFHAKKTGTVLTFAVHICITNAWSGEYRISTKKQILI